MSMYVYPVVDRTLPCCVLTLSSLLDVTCLYSKGKINKDYKLRKAFAALVQRLSSG